ncbi:p21-Rho-binding domain-containing protein [Ditylenchus destructor]|nr:p21-Rho-binding domain-containing protein [Ditylenchus destructor]
MATPNSKDRSKVRLRSFLGRIFNSSSAASEAADSLSGTKINEISTPFNTVHRIHVGYDGQKFSGLPQSWLDVLHRDISEADQKKNPRAVVTALKFYASSLKQKENEKYMITKSVYPSDDDIDVDLVIKKHDNGTPRPKADKMSAMHAVGSTSTLDSVRTSESGSFADAEKTPSSAPSQDSAIQGSADSTPAEPPLIQRDVKEDEEVPEVVPVIVPPVVPPRHITTVCTAATPNLSANSSPVLTKSSTDTSIAVPPVPAARTVSLNKGSSSASYETQVPQVPSTASSNGGVDSTPRRTPPPLPPKPSVGIFSNYKKIISNIYERNQTNDNGNE